jgi:hypothetical protein
MPSRANRIVCDHTELPFASAHAPPWASPTVLEPEHRKVVGPLRTEHLEDPLGRLETPELVLSEVPDGHVVDALDSRFREQHLPAVSRGADARDAVDIDADVVVVFDRGPAGVHADADPHLAAAGPRVRFVAPLDRERGADRILGIAERRKNSSPRQSTS